MRRLVRAIVLALLLLPVPSWGQGQLIPGNRTISGTFNAGVSTGTSTAYVLALNPAITTYVPDQAFAFRAHIANTGPATLQVNSAGAKNLLKWQQGVLVPLVAGDIRLGQEVQVMYDGTQMQAVSLGPNMLQSVGAPGTLQASAGANTLSGFVGSRCPIAGTFATEIQSTGALICNPASSTGGISSAKALLAQASSEVPSGVNLAALSSGLVLSTVSGGLATISTKAAPAGQLLGTTDVQEVTQTRVTPRQCSLPTTTTPLVVNLDDCDVFVLSELQQATLIANPLGSVRPSQPVRFRAHSTLARLMTWGSFWRANPGQTLPTETTGGDTEDVWLFEYSARLGQAILTYNSQQVVSVVLPPDTTLVGTSHALMTGLGPFTAGHCVQLDANLNLVDSGAACGSGGGGGGAVAGTTGDLQYNRAGVLAADTGNVLVDPTGHMVVATNFQAATLGNYLPLSDRFGHKGYLIPPDSMPSNWAHYLPPEAGELCVKGGSCFSGGGGSALTIQEIDGTPSGTPSVLKVSNGALTNNGDGSFTLVTGAGGGGNVSNSGTPAAGQAAEWVTATTIQGAAVTGTGSYVKQTSPTLTTPTIAKLANLTTNGAVVTSGSDGTLGVDTTTKLVDTGVQSLSTSTTYTCARLGVLNHCKMTMTGAAGTVTFAAPSGSPADGDRMMMRLRCTVGIQALAFDAIFVNSAAVSAPTSCPLDSTKEVIIGAIYSSDLTKWQVIAATN